MLNFKDLILIFSFFQYYSKIQMYHAKFPLIFQLFYIFHYQDNHNFIIDLQIFHAFMDQAINKTFISMRYLYQCQDYIILKDLQFSNLLTYLRNLYHLK